MLQHFFKFCVSKHRCRFCQYSYLFCRYSESITAKKTNTISSASALRNAATKTSLFSTGPNSNYARSLHPVYQLEYMFRTFFIVIMSHYSSSLCKIMSKSCEVITVVLCDTTRERYFLYISHPTSPIYFMEFSHQKQRACTFIVLDRNMHFFPPHISSCLMRFNDAMRCLTEAL